MTHKAPSRLILGSILPLLIYLHSAPIARTAEYRASGVLVSTTLAYDGKGMKGVSTNEFEYQISVRDGQWLMRIVDLEVKAGRKLGPEYTETGCDGVDNYTIRRYTDTMMGEFRTNAALRKRLDSSPLVRQADAARAKAEAKRATPTPAVNEVAEANPGVYPSHEVYFGRVVWMALASDPFFSSVTTNSIISPFDFFNRERLTFEIGTFKSEPRLPEKLKLLQPGNADDAGIEPPSAVTITKTGPAAKRGKEVLLPPFDQGYVNAEYTVTSTTNYNGMVLPSGFEFKRYKYSVHDQKPAVRLFNVLQSTNISYTSAVDLGSFVPQMRAAARVVDNRFPEARIRYYATNTPFINRNDPAVQGKLAAIRRRTLEATTGPKNRRSTFEVISVTSAILLSAMIFTIWLKRNTNKQTT